MQENDGKVNGDVGNMPLPCVIADRFWEESKELLPSPLWSGKKTVLTGYFINQKKKTSRRKREAAF